jgi:hypothetical protein
MTHISAAVVACRSKPCKTRFNNVRQEYTSIRTVTVKQNVQNVNLKKKEKEMKRGSQGSNLKRLKASD